MTLRDWFVFVDQLFTFELEFVNKNRTLIFTFVRVKNNLLLDIRVTTYLYNIKINLIVLRFEFIIEFIKPKYSKKGIIKFWGKD